jgi:transcriptional regulator with XRE-family HTH domain
MADALADKIRKARKDAGISPEKMAVTLGISVSTLMRMETGRTREISVQALMKIAKATKQPLSYFLGKAAA